MLGNIKILTVDETAARAALTEAAAMAAVRCDVANRSDLAGGDGAAFSDFDVVIVDESHAEEMRAELDRAGSSARLLVLCVGPPRSETLAMLRSGAADAAQHDDAAAIATLLRRAVQRRASAGNERHRHGLEEIVRERVRELEESHQRQRVSERMAAMGTLSTGIGHDIGNLVLPLRIGLESLESRKLPHGCEPDLHAIRKAVEYLQGLANGLRYLAMDPEDAGLGARHNDLAEWWADVEPLLNNCLPREVKLVRDFPDDLPYVSMPPHHLTQAVFNLVQNSGDAMRRHGPGTVCVRAEAVENNGMEPAHEATEPTLRLQVIDDGPGMAPEVRQRCLEPFFTTKFRGVRTGLGLSLVHGLVHRAGGDVDLDSEPGRGTTWTLLLPAKRRTDRQTPGARPVARVELADHRMRAYVTSVLHSLDFDVDGHSPAGRPLVCVVEADSPLVMMALSLLDEDERLRIVLFGHSPDGTHPRLHEVGAAPTSATIRATLRDIRAAM